MTLHDLGSKFSQKLGKTWGGGGQVGVNPAAAAGFTLSSINLSLRTLFFKPCFTKVFLFVDTDYVRKYISHFKQANALTTASAPSRLFLFVVLVSVSLSRLLWRLLCGVLCFPRPETMDCVTPCTSGMLNNVVSLRFSFNVVSSESCLNTSVNQQAWPPRFDTC